MTFQFQGWRELITTFRRNANPNRRAHVSRQMRDVVDEERVIFGESDDQVWILDSDFLGGVGTIAIVLVVHRAVVVGYLVDKGADPEIRLSPQVGRADEHITGITLH